MIHMPIEIVRMGIIEVVIVTLIEIETIIEIEMIIEIEVII